MNTPVYRRARYARRGSAPHDLVQVEDFTPPALEAGQVRVEVLAAPINPSDLMTINGDYGQLPPLPSFARPMRSAAGEARNSCW